MRYAIVQTNTFTRTYTRRLPGGRLEPWDVTFEAGRVIAEHPTRERVDRHCAKLRKHHPWIEFVVTSR